MKITSLPSEILSLVLAQLCLVRNIKGTKRTCRAFCDAAPEAEKALRRLYFEHDHVVGCVAAAADGRVITSSGSIKVWRDSASEHTIQALASAVAVLPGAARFVSGGSFDKTAKLWTLDGTLERTFEVGGRVGCVAALPDGAHFVVGLSESLGFGNRTRHDVVKLYDVDGFLVHTFTGHTDYVRAVAVTHDGKHIISGSCDALIKVWSVAGKRKGTCRGHSGEVHVVAAMPDGKRILSGGEDTTIRVWRLNGAGPFTFALHTDRVYALVALPDNRHALSGSYDRTVMLFNVNDGAILRTFRHHTDQVLSLALLPDGLRFVSGSADGTARIVEHGLVMQ